MLCFPGPSLPAGPLPAFVVGRSVALLLLPPLAANKSQTRQVGRHRRSSRQRDGTRSSTWERWVGRRRRRERERERERERGDGDGDERSRL